MEHKRLKPQVEIQPYGFSKIRVWKERALLNFSLCSCSFQLLGNFRRLILGDAFLDWFWSPLNQFLGFLKAKTRDSSDFLDDRNFIASEFGENNVKFGFFLCGGSAGITSPSWGSDSYGSRCGCTDSPLLFKFFYELGNLNY